MPLAQERHRAGRPCCHEAELHAHHGSSGVHIMPSPDTAHFELQPGAHTRRAAVEGVVANMPGFASTVAAYILNIGMS